MVSTGCQALGWAFRCSPDLEIQRDHAGHRAAERHRRFAGERFTQDLDAAGSRPAVDDVDLRKAARWAAPCRPR